MSQEFDGFEWDPEKSDWTRHNRGFDFTTASLVFDDEAYIEFDDLREDYGESRHVVIGSVGGEVLVVVWTPRVNKRRIISARLAEYDEREEYGRYRGAT